MKRKKHTRYRAIVATKDNVHSAPIHDEMHAALSDLQFLLFALNPSDIVDVWIALVRPDDSQQRIAPAYYLAGVLPDLIPR